MRSNLGFEYQIRTLIHAVFMKTFVMTCTIYDRDYTAPNKMRGLYEKPGVVWKGWGTYLSILLAFSWRNMKK
jgi:hypothetical protein